jgi:hypothetical protein
MCPHPLAVDKHRRANLDLGPDLSQVIDQHHPLAVAAGA